MAKNEIDYYTGLDKKIEDHKRFIEKCNKEFARHQKILQRIEMKRRKEDKNVTENF